jgi:hypothetical protein
LQDFGTPSMTQIAIMRQSSASSAGKISVGRHCVHRRCDAALSRLHATLKGAPFERHRSAANVREIASARDVAIVRGREKKSTAGAIDNTKQFHLTVPLVNPDALPILKTSRWRGRSGSRTSQDRIGLQQLPVPATAGGEPLAQAGSLPHR